MTFFRGSATDYLDLSDQLLDLCTGQSATAVVNAGGTGYSVGDILTVSGGTFTQAAQFEVVTLSGSAVLTIRQYHGGSYTVSPGSGAATTVSPAGGTGCTLDITLGDTGWVQHRALKQIGLVDVSVADGGTGYSVNDIVTITGGTGTAATVRVTAETGGVVDTVAVETHGEYTVAPSPTTGLATTGGNNDLTVNGTFSGSVDVYENILEGEGGGTDEIFVGWRTFENTPTSAFNWEMAGLDGFSAPLDWTSQPGKSPGEHDDQVTFQGGAYMLLSDTSMSFWANVTPFRIIMYAKVGSTYSSCHIGWLNRFGTATEIPYPMWVAGQTSVETFAFTAGNIEHSSIGDPIAAVNPDTATTDRGPAMLRLTSGTYVTCANSYEQSNSRFAYHKCGVYPAGEPVNTSPIVAPVDSDDQIVNIGFIDFVDIIPNSGNPGSVVARLQPTPDSGGDLALLIPCAVYVSDATLGLQFYGEIDGLYWVSGNQSSTLISEDTITVGTDRYIVFQSGLRTEPFVFYALKES